MENVKSFTQSKILKNLFVVLLGTALLAISSKIKIPFYPVPMTMQTFVVLMIGIGFGWKIGVATIALYLFEGIVGLPVFSGTPEKGIGFLYFTGPTMGYLLGFLVAVYVAGSFKYKDVFPDFISEFLKNYFKLLLSVSFIYMFGLLWLGYIVGWDKPIYEMGAEPFILAECFKILILSLLAGKISKLKKII